MTISVDQNKLIFAKIAAIIAVLITLAITAVIEGISNVATNFVPPLLVPDDVYFVILIIFYLIAVIDYVVIMFVRKKVLSIPGDDALLRASIITYAMSINPGILALVLYFMSGIKLHSYGLIVISLVYFVIYFPSERKWAEIKQ